MNKEKYQNIDYVSDENTCSELESLNKKNEDLSGFNLNKANLTNINLVNSIMKNTNLSRANLINSSLYGINLSGSNLFKTNFENANLNNANLQNCNLLGANFTNTKLNNIKWGKDYKVINELEAEQAYKKGNFELANKKYREAEDIYRNIKISMQSQTLGNDTGEFFIREMTAKRKQLNRFSLKRLGSKIIEVTTGYGEKLSNIAFTILGIIIVCMILYGIEGVSYQDKTLGFFSDDFPMLRTIGNLFYFSVVVYSTVGFGEMVPIGPLGKSIVIFEGIIGGIVLAILVIALYKKLMDR
tara:strand:- start:3364 stop:4260 length:897 start_codon:yes stop_codon:yes gene_type:complete